MKPVSQLMATMGNLPPAIHSQPLQVTPQTAEVVNDLFRRLRGIFPAWRQAWPSTEALDAAIRRAQEGQPLDGKILTGIGHDSQKTAFDLANELADQKAQAKIIEQGIPADGKSARELLLAKMNIKREAPRGKEGF